MSNIKKVLIAIDFSENSDKLLEKSCQLIDNCQAEIHITHIVEDLPRLSFYSDAYELWIQFRDQAVEKTMSVMNEYVQKFMSRYQTVHPIIEVGDPAEKIVNIGKELDVDIIIVGTHGRRGIDHFVHSSTAEKVVRRAKRPVLSIFIDKDNSRES